MKTTTRKEERYYLEKSKTGDFLKNLSSIAQSKSFLNHWNQTLYFNNSEHEVPFEVSIKARKYAHSPWGVSFKLDLDEEWIFEIKKDLIIEKSRLRQKERKNLALGKILKILQDKKKIVDSPLTFPLRPYIADDYRRKHYIIKGNDEFRITLDEEVKYYILDKNPKGKHLGSEDYTRVEFKVPQAELYSGELCKIENLLRKLNAESIISKKDMAYNLLSDYLKKKFARQVKPSDIEIEAKLSLGGKNQHVFHQIKNDFFGGFIKGFVIPRNFPYTLESGKLHRYVSFGNNQYKRISIKGMSKKLVFKNNAEVMEDPFGLNCIIKRREIEEPFSLELADLPSKTIYRKRKYFIVENKANRNSYCILLDRCHYNDQELFQIEIEGLLLSPTKEEEKVIIEDIAYLTNQILRRYKFLKPNPLSKLDWLKSIS